MNIVIIGANRGIGLGFVQHYLSHDHSVWAGYRQNKNELAHITHPNLHDFQWDVTENYSAAQVDGMKLPSNIDVLINNAGIYGPAGKQSLENVSRTALLDVFNVNCIGSIMAVQTLKKRLSDSSIIANISSKMGSSSDNSSGGTYAYRAAKAALIIASKSMSVDLAPIKVLSLHPGWVRTDMTGQSGLIDIEESVQGMAQVIAQCSPQDSGKFIAFDGKVIPY